MSCITADQEILQQLKAQTADSCEEDPEILEDEVEAAIRSLKAEKSPGIENIQDFYRYMQPHI